MSDGCCTVLSWWGCGVAGSRLSLQERAQIEVLFGQGLNYAEIGQALGRARQTISREIGRNNSYRGAHLGQGLGTRHPRGRHTDRRDGWGGGYRWVYSHRVAHERAGRRALRSRMPKLLGRGLLDKGRPSVIGPLWPVVEAKLVLKWSPWQISRWLRQSYPERPEMWVSHETIYQAVYYQARGAMREQVAEQVALRNGRRARRTPQARATRGGKAWTTGFNISTRPAEASDRAVPGHWEGDLIIGARSASAVITLVERTTRFVMLGALPQGRTSEEVIPVLTTLMSRVPDQLRRTLAWDQGAELARHADFTLASNCKVYFCDPRSPWQRGSNENTNGLLRQYLPRTTDMRTYSQTQLDQIAQELNERPRMTLNWETPATRLEQLLGATTT